MADERKIFLKNVWGYNAQDWPLIVFGKAENRQALLRASTIGDLIVLKTSNGYNVPPRDRGKILALGEFDRTPINSADILKPEILNYPDYTYSNGNFKWRYGLKLNKVWLLDNNPPISVLKYIKEYEAINSASKCSAALLLKEEDKEIILKLPKKEVPVGNSQNHNEIQSKESPCNSYPTTGPRPPIGSGAGLTYALRFGKRDTWKIGYTQKNINTRISEINANIPHESLGEKWQEYIFEKWNDAQIAYDMEQEALFLLRDKRTHGEIINCSEYELKTAWQKAKSKLLLDR